jgi:hypothetical protein
MPPDFGSCIMAAKAQTIMSAEAAITISPGFHLDVG